jgi:hypothetical protein
MLVEVKDQSYKISQYNNKVSLGDVDNFANEFIVYDRYKYR